VHWWKRSHSDLSIRRQCELLGVNRSGLYYEPAGENEENSGSCGCWTSSTRGRRSMGVEK